MSIKQVENIFDPQAPHFVGDGFRVHNFIPSKVSMEYMNPFIMLDYNSKFVFTPSETPRGVGAHPHRGFETVTIAYKGKVEHRDSSGSGGVISDGDVQWMTAASGVLHKEFHETEWSKNGGEFHMVQLWVNLPAQYKMSSPRYQAIANSDMPRVTLKDGYVEIIAGEYAGERGKAKTFSPVNLFNLKLKEGGEAEFKFPAEYVTALLVLEGDVEVNGQTVNENQFAVFKKEGDEFTVSAKRDALVLIMSAEHIDEPVAAYGPFVMNTEEEIQQAFEDFHNGKFGNL